MKADTHDRAKKLISVARVEGISTVEGQWLDAHLAECSECSNEARALSLGIDSLRTFSVLAPADAVRRASLAVHRRAAQRREREPAVFLWAAAVTSAAWAILTTPYVWAAFSWLGSLLHVPDTIWQLGFVMWWFLPATVLAAAASSRHAAKRIAELNWRQL